MKDMMNDTKSSNINSTNAGHRELTSTSCKHKTTSNMSLVGYKTGVERGHMFDSPRNKYPSGIQDQRRSKGRLSTIPLMGRGRSRRTKEGGGGRSVHHDHLSSKMNQIGLKLFDHRGRRTRRGWSRLSDHGLGFLPVLLLLVIMLLLTTPVPKMT